VELVEENRTIRREIVEMTRENRDLRREVVGNHNLINGLTDLVGREIDDRVSTVLYAV
jgi:hypothetical protein